MASEAPNERISGVPQQQQQVQKFADWETVFAEIQSRNAIQVRGAVIAQANSRTEWAEAALPTAGADGCRPERYLHIDAAAARAIGLQYSMDAERFGYLPPAHKR